MVTHSRATLGAHGLRALGLPRSIAIELDRGSPAVVQRGAQRHTVAQVDEVWRMAEAWWRDASLERTYYRLILEDGRPLDVFWDECAGKWFEQRYYEATR